jgi:hypothetical protein
LNNAIHMKLLNEDMSTTPRTASPEMILLGVDVGFCCVDATATPQETAYCRAIIKALFAAARAGGYPQRDTEQMLLSLISSPDPLRTAQGISGCITLWAWAKAIQSLEFETARQVS